MEEDEEETVDTSTMPDLTEMMVQMRVRGRTPSQIARETGVEVTEVQQRVHNHLLDNYNAETVAMRRLLMVTQVEQVIGALWDQVMEGDLATEGKQTKNLLDSMERLSRLLDLDKDRVRDELVHLHKAQTDLIHTILGAMRAELATKMMQAIQQVPTTGNSEEVKATMREQIDSGFSGWYAEAAERAWQQADSTVVTLDGQSASAKNYGDEGISE